MCASKLIPPPSLPPSLAPSPPTARADMLRHVKHAVDGTFFDRWLSYVRLAHQGSAAAFLDETAAGGDGSTTEREGKVAEGKDARMGGGVGGGGGMGGGGGLSAAAAQNAFGVIKVCPCPPSLPPSLPPFLLLLQPPLPPLPQSPVPPLPQVLHPSFPPFLPLLTHPTPPTLPPSLPPSLPPPGHPSPF